MKLTQGLAAVVLLASASIAQAEITGNASVVSDYNWRGITQTAGDPAIQGGIDYAHESGFYAGAWGSNVDFGDCCDENLETDLYFGWSGGEDITWNVGFIYYLYPGAEGLNFPEIYGSLGWKWLTGKISYSNDFGNTTSRPSTSRAMLPTSCRPTSPCRATWATATATPSKPCMARATTSTGRLA